MSQFAQVLIKENIEKHIKGEDASTLDLGNCGLTNEIPEELWECTWLTNLNLGLSAPNRPTGNIPGQNILNQVTSSSLEKIGSLLKLRSLNLSNNKIVDITALSTLQFLHTLRLGSNEIVDIDPIRNLKSIRQLTLRANKIKDISPLRETPYIEYLTLANNDFNDISVINDLKFLQHLDIYCNLVTDISPLDGLNILQELNLGFNQIADISVLSKLEHLEMVNLIENKILDISPLRQLKKLKRLYLKNNAISTFTESHLQDWQELHVLTLEGNPIKEIDANIIVGPNCLLNVKNFFRGLNEEAVRAYEAKIILVGNGGVGKTSVCRRLIDNTFNSDEPSTHAIQLLEWDLTDLAKETDLKKIHINIWDFGGQDIYHATHRIFMKTDAVFLLVWDEQTENRAYNEELIGNKKIRFANHNLRYWLSYVKILSNNSPVIVIQTKKDEAKGTANLSLTEQQIFNVKHSLAVESSRGIANGFDALKDFISQIVLAKVEYQCTNLPAKWFRVKHLLYDIRKSGVKSISEEKFIEMCTQEAIDRLSIETLREYLHATGALFYQPGLFENQLIIDQKWAIDAIYGLVDRKQALSRFHNNGAFTGEDLRIIWQGRFSEAEQELFIDFMLKCEMCFEKDYNCFKEFENRQFVAPQLLPSIKPEESISSAFNSVPSIYIRYRHQYLHDAIIQRFIARTGHIVNSREMWQKGILLRPSDGVAVIETNPIAKEILIRVGKDNRPLIDKILNELKEIGINEKDALVDYSFDGVNYVNREAIKNHVAENTSIQSERGEWLPAEPFQTYLLSDDKVRFDKPATITAATNDAVYFSYSWEPASDDIVNKLYVSLKDDGINVIRDKHDLQYKNLISEFMQVIGRGNIIVVPICDKYLRSDNCMYELSEIYRNSKLEKPELLKRIFPIRMESIRLNDPLVQREYLEYWQKRAQQWKSLVDEFGADQMQHRKAESIFNYIRDLLPFLSDINSLSAKSAEENNFEEIKRAIQERQAYLASK